jgi:predicted nucleotidyltransferase
MAAIIAHEAWHAKEHSAFPKWIFQLRKHEYDADAFAAQIAGIDATISMLENRDALMAKLSQEAVGVFHTFTIKISHPPTKKRIARLRNLEVGGKASQSTGFAMLSAELE